jgi:hypothetical protein
MSSHAQFVVAVSGACNGIGWPLLVIGSAMMVKGERLQGTQRRGGEALAEPN